MIAVLSTEADFRRALEESRERPVLLLKHSTACGISAGVRAAFAALAAEAPAGARFAELTVQESPGLSALVARETGIVHETPQVILLRDGAPAWHGSHGAVTREVLEEAIGRR